MPTFHRSAVDGKVLLWIRVGEKKNQPTPLSYYFQHLVVFYLYFSLTFNPTVGNDFMRAWKDLHWPFVVEGMRIWKDMHWSKEGPSGRHGVGLRKWVLVGEYFCAFWYFVWFLCPMELCFLLSFFFFPTWGCKPMHSQSLCHRRTIFWMALTNLAIAP